MKFPSFYSSFSRKHFSEKKEKSIDLLSFLCYPSVIRPIKIFANMDRILQKDKESVLLGNMNQYTEK